MNIILTGTVVRGDGLGRTFGFPTANVESSSNLDYGIYAGFAETLGTTYMAAIIINPTKQRKVVEAYVIDFEGDLYGRTVQLTIVSYIRPWEVFPSLEEGKRQIQADVLKVKEVLSTL